MEAVSSFRSRTISLREGMRWARGTPTRGMNSQKSSSTSGTSDWR